MNTPQQELVTYNKGATAEIAARDFMPVFDIQLAVERRNSLVAFTQQIMIDGLDYGKIPGAAKPCLLKAGAEKLCTFFGLVSEFTLTGCSEDWMGDDHGKEPFFYYRYNCRLTRAGRKVGEGDGSCNSWESKYRYRWVDESYALANGFDTQKLIRRGGTVSEFDFAIDKAETSGPYGKPAEYWERFRAAIADGTARKIKRKVKSGSEKPAWELDAVQYRVPNPDVADVVNTCQKMAQKRALIAATLISVNASEYFTQDLEDLQHIEVDDQPHDYIDIGNNPPNSKAAQQHVLDRKLKQEQPAPEKAEPSAYTKAEPWNWRSVQPHFEPLMASLGIERYSALLKSQGYTGLSQIPSREAALLVYRLLQAESEKPAPPAADEFSQPPAAAKTKQADPKPAAAAANGEASSESNRQQVVPEELQRLWTSMTDIKSTVAAFGTLKKDLFELVGDESGERQYRSILRKFGVENSGKFRSMDKARKAAGELWNLIGEMSNPAPIAEGITDDDLPALSDDLQEVA